MPFNSTPFLASLKRFLAFPDFLDEEQRITGRLLALFFGAIMLLITIDMLILLVATPRQAFRPLITIFTVDAVFLTILVFVKRGRIRLASFLAVGMAWLVVTLFAFTAGGVRAPSYAGYFVVTFLAGILLGGRAVFVMAAISGISGLGMAYLEHIGRLPVAQFQFTPFTFWLVDCSLVLILALLQSYASQTTKNSLKRAKTELAERTRAEQALQKSEDRYRSLFENLFDGLLLSQPDGTILSANPQACRMLGMTEAEVMRAGRMGILVADEKLSSALLERQQTGQIFTELTFRRGDGTTFPGEVASRVFTDIDGEMRTGILFRDITGRKVIENALRISEEKFANAFYHSPALLSISQIKDGRVIEANQAFLDAFGFAREEVIGHTTLELDIWDHPEDRENFLGLFRQGYQHIPVQERCWRTKSRECIFLQGSFNIIPIEGEDYVLSVLENITERKRAEQALRESEARFQTLVEQAPVAIMISRDGQPVYINQALIRMMRVQDVAQSLQRPVIEYFAPEFREEGQTTVLRRAHGLPAPEQFDATLMREDGVLFPAHLSIATIMLSDGPANVTFINDITERKQAEEQIKASLQQLHVLSAHLQTIREEERTHIAREIHDELGQALTGIKMDLFWLKNRFEKQEGSLGSKPIANQLSNLLAETDQLIDTVRRISTDLRPSILDTLGLIAALEWLTGDFQNRSGIACLFQTPLKALDVPQDFSTAVFRICQEALTNVARHAQASSIMVQLSQRREKLVLSIEDNGKGITDEEIHRLGSLGILGMKERALGFHGQVDLRRSAKGGTCVTAWFPLPGSSGMNNSKPVEDV